MTPDAQQLQGALDTWRRHRRNGTMPPRRTTNLLVGAAKRFAAVLESGERVELRACCEGPKGLMTSPNGDVVSGNGECAEFLLPPGDYLIVPAGLVEGASE